MSLAPALLLAATTALTALVSEKAGAQTATPASQGVPSHGPDALVPFNIPAGPLSSALTAFSIQAHTPLGSQAPVLAGKVSPGLQGRFTTSDALARLLQGSGLTYRLTADHAYQIAPASSNITLGPVRVGGSLGRESATGPGVGYVAHYTESGTKTATPLTQIPNSIYVITKDEILDQQAQNINEVLRYMPGVYAESGGTGNNGAAEGNLAAGSSSSLSMRGFASSEFVDGIQSRSASAGETAFVERVEALMGPSSVLYGAASPGGMILTRLKTPTQTPLRNATVGFGNWGRYEATVDVSDKINTSGTLKYRIAAIGVTQDTQTDYLHYKRVGVLPSIKWDIDDKTSLTLLGQYMYTPESGLATGYPGIGTLVPGKYGYIPRSRYLGDPGANTHTAHEGDFEYQFYHKFNRFLEFHQTFRYENSNDYMNRVILVQGLQSDGETYPRHATMETDKDKTIALDSQLTGHFSVGDVHQTVIAGMDFRRVEIVQKISTQVTGIPSVDIWAPQYYVSHPDYSFTGDNTVRVTNDYDTVYQKGIYFQDQIKWKKLTVTLGGRQDWYNNGGPYYAGSHTAATTTPVVYTPTKEAPSASKFTWRAGFTYNFDFGLTPYFSYATSFIPQIGSFNADGRPMAPLTGDQFEAGLKYIIPKTDIFLTASAFHIKEHHFQVDDPENPGLEMDAGTVVSKGIEVSAHANVTKNLRLTASYSFVDAKVTKSDTSVDRYDMYGNDLGLVPEQGKYLDSVPRNMVNMFADYTLPRSVLPGFGINFGARYIGWTYSDSANSYKLPPHIIFDAGAHYDFGQASPVLKGLSARLAMSNLADTRYLASCSSNGYGGTCYYGQGRRVYGNISYSW
ncbi:TonB-dependent siderophore receptor [Acetobacter sp. TBRC 12305]|uniref:TonB-dependent siderophore receptor n=1 Tax=Acetobacter garciniae TaxID=2817435 RepID=A0A939HHF3_9PROT|nr:TonB-dependent siderophore receptor [Acetobacter garciniae]MBX0344152.1 TonB-dependent siderophore receptor [Acetobacter garciniae]